MCPADTLQQLKSQGALLLDVRTPQEFAGGHAPGALNIPVATLQARFLELDRQKPILVCCASGARSAWAKNFLDAQGFQTVHNAGPWQRLIA